MSIARIRTLIMALWEKFPHGIPEEKALAAATRKEEALSAAGLTVEPSPFIGSTFSFTYCRNHATDVLHNDICVGYGSIDGITLGRWQGDTAPTVSLTVSGLELIPATVSVGVPKIGAKVDRLQYNGGEIWVAFGCKDGKTIVQGMGHVSFELHVRVPPLSH